MTRRRRFAQIIVLLSPLIVLGVVVRVDLAPIHFTPEILFEISLAGMLYPISNTLLSSWVVVLLLIVLALASTRRMSLVPSGLQNLMEALVEGIHSLVVNVAGEERGQKFFPIVATIFLFVLFSNWMGLLPGVGTIGFVHEGAEGEAELIPLLRPPSTDLNMPLALALISVGLSQVFGVQTLGFLGYVGKFINVRRLIRFVKALVRPQPGERPLAYLGNGALDLITGLIELISEVAKIIAFTFRLFGNIFAGEVLLLVMAFFFPFLLPLIFFLFETFVGFIQAFIFAILTLFFMTLATTAHVEAEHH